MRIPRGRVSALIPGEPSAGRASAARLDSLQTPEGVVLEPDGHRVAARVDRVDANLEPRGPVDLHRLHRLPVAPVLSTPESGEDLAAPLEAEPELRRVRKGPPFFSSIREALVGGGSTGDTEIASCVNWPAICNFTSCLRGGQNSGI